MNDQRKVLRNEQKQSLPDATCRASLTSNLLSESPWIELDGTAQRQGHAAVDGACAARGARSAETACRGAAASCRSAGQADRTVAGRTASREAGVGALQEVVLRSSR